ncbi:MAG: aminomethyl-transferring glycine dehydrogenase subunit GcvPA, partial [Treponema sp.]|nr:aminomethyl-transferring glycine dehydrogenase subunit GcvPA [Treponema sp.]
LQAIFEFQTMICRLTGFDATNASIYDGASAAGEAVAMCRDRKRRRALVSATVNPAIAEVVKTYSWAADGAVDMAPEKNGLTDMGRLEQMLDEGVSSILIQQPNYYGLIEDARGIVALAREKGVKVIVSANPIAMAILQTPAECGADIAVGDGQPLGIPLSFGGPYLGFIAATNEFLRKIPGRIVGETSDAQGRRAFVLTLQAREQHIRRETAGSNLCTSQVLCALAASAYMAAMGPEGMAQAASQSMSKAHYLAAELAKAGFPRRHDAPFFHEFVTECPVEPEALMDRLAQNGILGGLPLPGGGVLWCATEMNSAEEIDRLVALCKEAQK